MSIHIMCFMLRGYNWVARFVSVREIASEISSLRFHLSFSSLFQRSEPFFGFSNKNEEIKGSMTKTNTS